MNSFLITQYPINMYIDKKKSKMNFLINNNKLNKIKAKSWKLIYCDVSIKVKTIVNFFFSQWKNVLQILNYWKIQIHLQWRIDFSLCWQEFESCIPFSSDVVDFSLVPSASSAVESLQNKTEFYPLFKELCLSF